MIVLDVKISDYAENLHAAVHFAVNGRDLTRFL